MMAIPKEQSAKESNKSTPHNSAIVKDLKSFQSCLFNYNHYYSSDLCSLHILSTNYIVQHETIYIND